MYLNAKIYTEAIKNFNQGLEIEADIVDKNYIINLDFGEDPIIIDEFQNTLMEIALYDSTITCDQLLLGILNIKLNGDINVDHSLDVLDLVQMINIIINQTIYSNWELTILDSNSDNSFNVLDIVIFVNNIIGE